MCKLIKCPTCNKMISEEIEFCLNCYQPINPKEDSILIAYEIDGKVLNTPLYQESIEKIRHLRLADAVELLGEEYKLDRIIFSCHNNVVRVILTRD